MSFYESAYNDRRYGDKDVQYNVHELKEEIEKLKAEKVSARNANKIERTGMLYAIEKLNTLNASLKNKLKAAAYMRAQIEEMSVLLKKTCPICYEEYVLEGVEVLQNCGHTTCKTCLAELTRRKLCCPLCRAELN